MRLFVGLQTLVVGALLLAGGCSTNTYSVRLQDSDGTPLSGYVVTLLVIDDSGAELDSLDTQITNTEGAVTFGFKGTLSSSLIAAAQLPDGVQRSFLAGEVKDPAAGAGSPATLPNIDAISEAVVTAVLYVTASAGGRSLLDFTSSEIQYLAGLARQQLATLEALDLQNSSAVVNAVIAQIGRDIADAAGGSVTAQPQAEIVGANVVSIGLSFVNDPTFCSKDVALMAADTFIFDIKEDGQICNINAQVGSMQDALDGGSALSIIGDAFSGSTAFPGDSGLNPAAPFPTVTLEDEREIVFGPVTSDAGLLVTRKVMVYEDRDVVRYLEIIENPTNSTKTIDVRLTGDFGYTTPTLLFNQQATATFDESSAFAAFVEATPNPNPPRPAVGFIIGDNVAPATISTVSFPPEDPFGVYFYTWEDVSIAADATVVLLHYVTAAAAQSEALISPTLEEIFATPDMQGFSASELNHLQNFLPAIGNVVGEAGSVASFANLTITNVTQDVSVSAAANQDGSFLATLSSVTGDELQIEGNDGTDLQVSVE